MYRQQPGLGRSVGVGRTGVWPVVLYDRDQLRVEWYVGFEIFGSRVVFSFSVFCSNDRLTVQSRREQRESVGFAPVQPVVQEVVDYVVYVNLERVSSVKIHAHTD